MGENGVNRHGHTHGHAYSPLKEEDVEKGQSRQLSYVGMAEETTEVNRCAGQFMNFCHKCSNVEDDFAGAVADDDDEYTKKIILTGLEAGVAGTYCWFFERIIHNSYCDFIYDCHCTWTWAGGWDDCNVHNKEGKPKCPWCMARQSVEWTTNILPFFCMIIAYLYMLYNRKRCDYVIVRLAVAMATYFLIGAIVGLIFYLASPDYNYFLGIKS